MEPVTKNGSETSHVEKKNDTEREEQATEEQLITKGQITMEMGKSMHLKKIKDESLEQPMAKQDILQEQMAKGTINIQQNDLKDSENPLIAKPDIVQENMPEITDDNIQQKEIKNDDSKQQQMESQDIIQEKNTDEKYDNMKQKEKSDDDDCDPAQVPSDNTHEAIIDGHLDEKEEKECDNLQLPILERQDQTVMSSDNADNDLKEKNDEKDDSQPPILKRQDDQNKDNEVEAEDPVKNNEEAKRDEDNEVEPEDPSGTDDSGDSLAVNGHEDSNDSDRIEDHGVSETTSSSSSDQSDSSSSLYEPRNGDDYDDEYECYDDEVKINRQDNHKNNDKEDMNERQDNNEDEDNDDNDNTRQRQQSSDDSEDSTDRKLKKALIPLTGSKRRDQDVETILIEDSSDDNKQDVAESQKRESKVKKEIQVKEEVIKQEPGNTVLDVKPDPEYITTRPTPWGSLVIGIQGLAKMPYTFTTIGKGSWLNSLKMDLSKAIQKELETAILPLLMTSNPENPRKGNEPQETSSYGSIPDWIVKEEEEIRRRKQIMWETYYKDLVEDGTLGRPLHYLLKRSSPSSNNEFPPKKMKLDDPLSLAPRDESTSKMDEPGPSGLNKAAEDKDKHKSEESVQYGVSFKTKINGDIIEIDVKFPKVNNKKD